MIFGRKITKRYRGQRQTVIEDLNLPNPVIRSHYGQGFIKQYVRDHLLLRTEAATNNVADYAVPTAIDHLSQLRPKLSSIVDHYQNVQQDILETFVDRGQLRTLSHPTILPTGQRIPGLTLDHPRQLALMHALVRFSHIAAGGTFTTAALHARAAAALSGSPDDYRLSSLRYELSKLRAKGLIEKLPGSRRYRSSLRAIASAWSSSNSSTGSMHHSQPASFAQSPPTPSSRIAGCRVSTTSTDVSLALSINSF